jgi:hypothetical protein
MIKKRLHKICAPGYGLFVRHRFLASKGKQARISSLKKHDVSLFPIRAGTEQHMAYPSSEDYFTSTQDLVSRDWSSGLVPMSQDRFLIK